MDIIDNKASSRRSLRLNSQKQNVSNAPKNVEEEKDSTYSGGSIGDMLKAKKEEKR